MHGRSGAAVAAGRHCRSQQPLRKAHTRHWQYSCCAVLGQGSKGIEKNTRGCAKASREHRVVPPSALLLQGWLAYRGALPAAMS